MFGKQLITDMISRSAENEADRRVFLKSAGVAGLGAVGAATVGGGLLDSASAAGETSTEKATDAAVLNFALNLEYLEAEFYLNAVFGHGLNSGLTGGKEKKGKVIGGAQVPFTPGGLIGKYAKEIAMDELDHVKFLRKALGSAKVAMPQIDIQASFTAAAQAAGVVPAGTAFNPYADEVSFLLGAFIFEDVGVTAYKGAAPLITNKTYLEAAAGILAVEAYHAGIVRTTLYAQASNGKPELFDVVDKISALRDGADGGKHDDQGIGNGISSNLVPTDKNSIAFSRTAAHVLNVVYLNPKSVKRGGFFPQGMNGAITVSMGSKNK